jgi:hypothetical protein
MIHGKLRHASSDRPGAEYHGSVVGSVSLACVASSRKVLHVASDCLPEEPTSQLDETRMKSAVHHFLFMHPPHHRQALGGFVDHARWPLVIGPPKKTIHPSIGGCSPNRALFFPFGGKVQLFGVTAKVCGDQKVVPFNGVSVCGRGGPC